MPLPLLLPEHQGTPVLPPASQMLPEVPFPLVPTAQLPSSCSGGLVSPIMNAAGAYRIKALVMDEDTDWSLLAGGTGECSSAGRSPERPEGELQPKGRFRFLGNSHKMHPCMQRNLSSSFKAPRPHFPQ